MGLLSAFVARLRVRLHRSEPRFWHLRVLAVIAAGVIVLATCGIGKTAEAHFEERCDWLGPQQKANIYREIQLAFAPLGPEHVVMAFHVMSHESSCDRFARCVLPDGIHCGSGLFQFTYRTWEGLGYERSQLFYTGMNIRAAARLVARDGWGKHWRVCRSWEHSEFSSSGTVDC